MTSSKQFLYQLHKYSVNLYSQKWLLPTNAEAQPKGATPCLRPGAAAERSYPTPEVRGSSERTYPMPKVRGRAKRSNPMSKEWPRGATTLSRLGRGCCEDLLPSAQE